MRYATIKTHDIANGVGIRVSLFVSGCRHHCRGCFNQETWDFNYGKPFTDETLDFLMDACNHDYIEGFSFLGGEPFDPANQPTVLKVAKKFKELYPDKTIWCYTGYDFEKDILAGRLGDPAITKELIGMVDILVDGEFHIDEKDLKLRFRGSSNQRVIEVKKSLAEGRVVLWDDNTDLC